MDCALYPVALIVIAAYYVLFATMGGAQALGSELIAATLFVVVAIVGFRSSLWWVAAGIAGHGIFDWVPLRVTIASLLDQSLPVYGFGAG